MGGYTSDAIADPSNEVYYHIAAAQQSNEYPPTAMVRANLCIIYDVTSTEPSVTSHQHVTISGRSNRSRRQFPSSLFVQAKEAARQGWA